MNENNEKDLCDLQERVKKKKKDFIVGVISLVGFIVALGIYYFLVYQPAKPNDWSSSKSLAMPLIFFCCMFIVALRLTIKAGINYRNLKKEEVEVLADKDAHVAD